MKIGKKRRVIDDKVIEVAQTEMKKRVARETRTKKFKRFYWMPAFALILIFGFFSPWIFTTGINNQIENDFIWGSSLLPVEVVSFNDLTPIKTKSIVEISKLKKEPISSLVKSYNKQTIAYTLNNEIIALEEYSTYDSLECYLFLINRNTNLFDFSLTTLRYDKILMINDRSFFYEYNEEEGIYYIRVIEDHQYYFKIHTNDITILEGILGLFREN
ncbi:MAG: hypothetical protein K2N64_03925 [Anaeroplasmataceae bacterium]|nr:hypothetical protein [Anaeroplasmataceae bacterium]